MRIGTVDSINFPNLSDIPLSVGKIEKISDLDNNKDDLEFLTKRLSSDNEIKYKKLLMEIVVMCEDPNNRTNMSILKMSKFLDNLREKILKEIG